MERYPQVRTAHWRSRIVVALLGLVCVFDGMHEAEAVSGPLTFPLGPRSLLAMASTSIFYVCGVAFFAWVVAFRRAATALDAAPGRDAARHVILGFILPIVALWWPYAGLRDFDRAVDPSRVPDAPPRPNPAEHAFGYRDAAAAPVARRAKFPRPPLELWWALFLTRYVLTSAIGFVAMRTVWPESLAVTWALQNGFDCAAAIAAALVVLRMDARLGERARRCAALEPALTASRP
jgi:hypothetical protein